MVLHVRLLRRSGSGESELDANQLFGSVEQHLFTQALSLAEKRGKTIRLAVVSANDLWDGILRAGVNLQSSTVVLGGSTKLSLAEEAREVGLAWENLPDPRPAFNLEIFSPGGGQHEFFRLGPHAPNLTMNEVNLVHRLWLRLNDLIAHEEIHHHDVVHFALNELQKEIADGKESREVAAALEGALSATTTRGLRPRSNRTPPPELIGGLARSGRSRSAQKRPGKNRGAHQTSKNEYTSSRA